MNQRAISNFNNYTIQFFTTAAVCLLAAVFLTDCVSHSGEKVEASKTSAAVETKAATKTLGNLQAAFNGESNAHAKYLVFSKKADDEGYAKVAGLFRAAARAEEIHARNHAEVIRKMGGTPKSEVKLPEIKTTRENLEDSVKGETYERDTMYPDFLLEARNTGNKDALRTFNLAKTAEAEHAKLYAEALGNLESWKGGTTTFYVCPTCGYTTTNPDLEKCPVDFVPKEKFEAIS